MFGIEVEFLTGVCVAATPGAREEPEWPPHPDRLYQALVASWARNDQPREEERQALVWLESLECGPKVFAANAHQREVATVFVPPSDARTFGRLGSRPPANLSKALRVIPELRKNRQARVFPAVIPHDGVSVVRYVWNEPLVDSCRDALKKLVACVHYLGHSHSLVRVSVIESYPEDGDLSWTESFPSQLRTPYAGRLEELERRYQMSLKLGRILRPNVSTKLVSQRGPAKPAAATVFDPEPLAIFGDDGGLIPALDAFPSAAKRMRDALMAVAKDQDIPIGTVLSGHEPDESPTSEPHLAIVPLADIGWEWSSGRLMGLALLVPRACKAEDRQRLEEIITAFAANARLQFSQGAWRLSAFPDPRAASLRIGRFVRPSRRWGTVLPTVLDRFPKAKPGEDLATIVARACIRVGLSPEQVDGVQIEVHKYSAVRGAPSAVQVADHLAQDSPYRSRPIRHLVLTFPKPVGGPLLIGAGRYRGLGLCLPLDERGQTE